MTQDTATDHEDVEDDGTQPRPAQDEQAPLPPSGWDPYSPPTRSAPPSPTGWDPYAPPVRSAPPSPSGWDPYSPPTRSAPPSPTGWDPYTPPRNGSAHGASAVAPVSAGPPPVSPSGGWVQGAAIVNLWSSAEAPGVWIAVHGIGWRLLSSASESGHSHLTHLALLARDYRLPVCFHEDSRGRVDQLLI